MSAPVSMLTAWVTLPNGERVRAISAEVTLDESWKPFASAQVVIPWTAARYASLDPRNGGRVTVLIRRQWYASQLLGDLTKSWTGKTLANLTTSWAGKTLADLTASWRTAWQAAWRAPDELVCSLGVRSRDLDYADSTITVRAASDELAAQDARASITRPLETLAQRVTALLTAANISVTSADFAAAAPFVAVPAGTFDWSQSLWDHAEAAAANSSLRLWCDETGKWHMASPNAGGSGVLNVTRVTDARESVDRDGEWASAIAFTAKWTSADGTTDLTETRTAPDPLPAGLVRWVHIEQTYEARGDSWPGPSYDELVARLAVRKSQDRALTLTAPADPTARPGQTITTGAPSLASTSGVVSSVRIAIPEDTMTITTRATVDA